MAGRTAPTAGQSSVGRRQPQPEDKGKVKILDAWAEGWPILTYSIFRFLLLTCRTRAVCPDKVGSLGGGIHAARADHLGGGPFGRPETQSRRACHQALEEEGRAKRENIHVAFLDVPATNYAEAGVLVADQKRSP